MQQPVEIRHAKLVRPVLQNDDEIRIGKVPVGRLSEQGIHGFCPDQDIGQGCDDFARGLHSRRSADHHDPGNAINIGMGRPFVLHDYLPETPGIDSGCMNEALQRT